MLGTFERVLLALLLLVLMAGMGATLTPKSFRDVAKRPAGVLIGLASQFGWMPLVAFGLGKLFGLSAPLALGLLIVGCTPGGTTSNLFSYYARADVALSISMTVVSTVVAVAAMPLLVGLYAASIGEVDVPLGSIATTLVLLLLPVAIGMGVRAKSQRGAKRLERAGSISGVLVLVVLIGASVFRNLALFATIPATGYMAAFLLGAIGMAAGYGSATLLGQAPASRRAIALETGIQNSPLAFAIVLATLPANVQDEALRLPMLYALFVLMSASVATAIFRRAEIETV
ncbi:MAG: bile acid:sodium symporter [Myxococcota bacterium]